MELKDIIKIVKDELEQKGIVDSAESEWLVALALGESRSSLMKNRQLSKIEERKVMSYLKKRKRHVPLSQIAKSASFYGYELKVNSSVLTPRPETEELVFYALKDIDQSSKVLDIGTGSGAIAIAVKKEANAIVTAVDFSQRALRLARKNAEKLKAEVKFVKSDLFKNLKGEKFDVIISNPPYISENEFRELEPEVRCHEPRLALVAKNNGLGVYEKIIKEAAAYLTPHGKIFFEIGENQGEEVKALLEKDYKEISIIKDLQAKDRIVRAVKK